MGKMKKKNWVIYLVCHYIPYEYDFVIGVYSNEESAKEHVKACKEEQVDDYEDYYYRICIVLDEYKKIMVE